MDDVRATALALPEVTEADHRGMASFRVRGRIFATVPDSEHVRIMLDENGIRSAVAEDPLICDEFYWGKKLACVVVAVALASTDMLRELLTDAWLLKARRRSRGELATPASPRVPRAIDADAESIGGLFMPRSS